MRYVLQNGVPPMEIKDRRDVIRCRRHSAMHVHQAPPRCVMYFHHRQQNRNARSCNNTIRHRALVVVKSPGTTRRVARIHLALALPSSFSSLPLITSRHPSSSPASIRFSPLPHFWMPIDQCAKLAGGRRAGSRLPRESRRGQTHAFAMCGELPLH